MHSYLHLNLFQPLSMRETLLDKYFIMAWGHYFTDLMRLAGPNGLTPKTHSVPMLIAGYTKACHDAILELVSRTL